MSELIINDHTSLDRNLVLKWQAYRKVQKSIGWTEYIKTLGEGIINCTRLSGDRKSTRLNSSHIPLSRMPSSA